MAERIALSEALSRLDACAESLAWAAPYGTDWERALAECPSRRWLTWLAAVLMRRGRLRRGRLRRGRLRREVLVVCACACARTVWHLLPEGGASRRAVETAEAWARGEATLDEVRAARRRLRGGVGAAAYAAWAAADAAAYAADAAAYAADADDAAAYAAARAAAAGVAAAYAAAWAADADADYARAAAEVELLAITRRELGPALLAGLAACAEVSRG